MAWSFPRKFSPEPTPELQLAHEYQRKVCTAVSDFAQKRTPVTAGAGNGQGRKPKWKSATKAMRLPAKYEGQIIEFARGLEEAE